MGAVVHVYKDYPPVRGGVESHVDVLTRLLVERGVSAEVLCSRRPETVRSEERFGVHVRRCASPLALASTPLPAGLPAALWRSRAKLIHAHYPWPPGELASWLARRGRPLVVTVHCEIVRYRTFARLLAPLYRQIFSAAQRILVSSVAMAGSEVLVGHGDRVRVVPFGVDLNRFCPSHSAEDPLPEVAHPRIIYVGRLRYYKGLTVLAAALARLPQARLVVVGDGPERPAFETALREHHCRERAHLLGEVEEDRLLQLLQTADAAVLPSTSGAEAFGLAIAEAQACGLPAVTTDVGTGTAQTVADGVSGRVIPPNSAAALAEALTWCLDPSHASARRAAARAHAEAALCARRMTNSVHQIYCELVEL